MQLYFFCWQCRASKEWTDNRRKSFQFFKDEFFGEDKTYSCPHCGYTRAIFGVPNPDLDKDEFFDDISPAPSIYDQM